MRKLEVYTGTHNLDNFNPFAHNEPLLDSPRSLEACRRQGIDPKELIPKSMEECRKHLGSYTDDLVRIYYEAAEERRKYKFQLVLEERKKILGEESGGREMTARPKSAGPVTAELEERRILAARRRQENELRQASERQRLYQDTLAKNRLREEQAAQREAARRQEIATRQAEREQKRLMEETKRKKETLIAEMTAKQKKKEAFEREMEKLRQAKMNEKRHKAALKAQISERDQKKAAFEANIKAKLDYQMQTLSQKRELIQKRDLNRKLIFEKQQNERKNLTRQRNFEKSRKIQSAKDNLAQILQSTKQEIESKQQFSALKLAAIQNQKMQEMQRNREKALEKQKNISKVVEMKQVLISQKKMMFLEEMKAADKRLEMREKEKIRQKRELEAWEMRKNEMRREVRDRMETLKNLKKREIMNKLESKSAAVSNFMKSKNHRIHYLQLINTIKREQKHEEVKRISRKQAYYRELVLRKIQSEDRRMREFRLKREYETRLKLKLRSDMERQKGDFRVFGKSPSVRTLPNSPLFLTSVRPGTATTTRLGHTPKYDSRGYTQSSGPYLLLV